MAWLGVADYLVFTLVIGIALAVGLYEALAGGGQKNTSTYMVGDRRLKLVPALASMFMSSISAIRLVRHQPLDLSENVEVKTNHISTLKT